MNLGERFCRCVLLLFPRSFRARFADEVVEFLRDHSRAEQRRGAPPLQRALSLLAALAELALSAGREWLELARGLAVRPGNALPGTHLPVRKDDMWESLLQDVKYGARALSRRPALSLAIVFTLALGIGVNCTLFGVVDAVLFKSLPYPQPEQLQMVWNRYGTARTASSPPDYADRRDQSQFFSGLAAFVERPLGLTESCPSGNCAGDNTPLQVRGCRVTASFFNVLGHQPQLGQALFPPEESADPQRLVVLSHGLWQRRFGSDPTILGRPLRLDGEEYIVSAVMPAQFDLPRGTEVWTPLYFTPAQLANDFRGNEYLQVIGRLRPEVSLEQAQSEMTAIAARVIDTVPDRSDFLRRNAWGAEVVPLRQQLVGEVETGLLVLLGAVGCVLLIACANIANLLLAGSTSRLRELAVRTSLGASRTRLLRHLLTEHGLLAVAGAALGLGLTLVALALVPRLVPYDIPRIETVALDARLLAFNAGLALITALTFGLLPAWQAASGQLVHRVREGTRHLTARRSSQAIVVSEVALALVLMIGAGLLVRSFFNLTNRELGFDPGGCLTFRLNLPQRDFPNAEVRRAFEQELLTRLARLPGVETAATSYRVPLDGQNWTRTFRPLGQVPAPGEKSPGAEFNLISPDYLSVLGIPLLQGRGISSADGPTAARVVLVDQRTADRFWPAGAVGQRLDLGDAEQPDVREIIGVVGSVLHNSLAEEGRLQIYAASAQAPPRNLTVTLKTRDLEPAQLIGPVRHALAELAPALPVAAVRTLADGVRAAGALPRFQLAVLGGFALLALLLAAAGLYGVVAHSVAQRTPEIGLRMALGARALGIQKLVFREGLGLVVWGLALGWLSAMGLSRFLASLLYGVATTDFLTYTALSLILLTIAAAAVFLPAWRASRLDPVNALRDLS